MTIGISWKISQSLLATPDPLPEESCASWIQRVAAAHQYTMPRLMQVLGNDVVQRDWDAPLSAAFWQRVQDLTGVASAPHESALRVLGTLGNHTGDAGLLWQHKGRPRYRWCNLCLATDTTPYLRWHWRLTAVCECWVHRQELSQECPGCSAAALVHRGRLVAVGRTGRAANLAYCDQCGMPLHAPQPLENAYNRSLQQRLRSALRLFRKPIVDLPSAQIEEAVTIFLAAASGRPVPRTAGSRKARKRRPQSTAEAAARRKNAWTRALANAQRLRELRAQALRWTLSGQSFRRESMQQWPSPDTPVIHWSWKLGPQRRIAVASALWAIRAERRLEKQCYGKACA